MSTTSSSPITPNLPEFPYSPASEARRHLKSLYSSSHFVTTVVTPPPLGPPPPQRLRRPSGSQPLDRQESTDPLHPLPPLADSSSAEISTLPPSEGLPPPACSAIPSIPSETAQLNGPASPPVGISTARVKSSNPRLLSSKAYSFVQAPVLIGTGKGCVAWPSPRSRSAWQRFKRMGNRLVTPLRSMGICLNSCSGGRQVMTFCEDFAAHDASPGSSWYSSGEYPPEFIRDVLENNVLVGELAVK